MQLSTGQYGKILYELTCPPSTAASGAGRRAKDGDKKDIIDEVIEQFIVFLAQEQMLSKIDYIIKEFVDYAKEQAGIAQLKITSARSLSESEIKKIAKHFGDKAEVEVKVDKSLLGGVKVKSKNTILDASLRTQIQRLEKKLKS